MNRRGFLGVLGSAVGVAAIPSSTHKIERQQRLHPDASLVRKADMSMKDNCVLGVATEDVRAGDVLQVQVRGYAVLRAKV